MKILISPAKSLDYTSPVPTTNSSSITFLEQAKEIQGVLQELSVAQIQELMKISDALAKLNWDRNQSRSFVVDPENQQEFRQAVFAFNGDVYGGLDAYTLDQSKWEIMQDKLRILSGLYGFLKPFDLIEPYRLEMGTKLPIGPYKDLYAFWKPILAQKLNEQTKPGELLVNLASKEYFSAIDKKALHTRLVTPEFKELRQGKLKTISFYAKKARGQMVRYILENNIEDLEGLKNFNVDNYVLSEELSKGDLLVFTR
ncbi:peroxide stress protein YaaA [Myroides sp. LJL116]